MMDWDTGHMGTGWGALMVLGMLVIWVLVALAVVWFVRTTRTPYPSAGPHGAAPGGTPGAEQILAERLARGEIEPADYQARLTALRSAK